MSYKISLCVVLAFGLSACSQLPHSGPSASAIVDQAAQKNQPSPYTIVDLNAAVIDVLSHRPQSSFASRFGDHRPSKEPVIGIGDGVTVTIWEASAGGLFSSPAALERISAGSNSATIPEQIVGRDGAISVPYAGRIHVAGKAARDVQEIIQHALNGKAIQPQVLVTDNKPISSTVTIGGEGIGLAQRVPLSVKGDRILDVIAQAGGVRAPVNELFIVLQRNNVTERVSLQRVTTDARENIYMRPGDVVTLVRDPQTFLTYGAINGNAEIPFGTDHLTLAQALAKSGGLNDYRSDARGVFVFRLERKEVTSALQLESLAVHANLVPVVYHLDMTNPNSLFLQQQFLIANHDLIYVSNAPSVELQKAVDIFNGLASPLYNSSAAAATVSTIK